jgi:hypothetical protein
LWPGCALSRARTERPSSWPGLSRPSRLGGHGRASFIGMPATSAGMTVGNAASDLSPLWRRRHVPENLDKKLIPARSRALILPAILPRTEGCLYSIFRRGAGSGGRGMALRRRCGEAARRSKPHRPGAHTARHGAPVMAGFGSRSQALPARPGPTAVVRRPRNPKGEQGLPERYDHRGRYGANL